jgi:hypothetical protein
VYFKYNNVSYLVLDLHQPKFDPKSLGSAYFERNVKERKRDERIREEILNFSCLEHDKKRRETK